SRAPRSPRRRGAGGEDRVLLWWGSRIHRTPAGARCRARRSRRGRSARVRPPDGARSHRRATQRVDRRRCGATRLSLARPLRQGLPRNGQAPQGMTRYFDLRSTVLIVVGHGLLPEEEDRPIAYELKRLVNTRAGESDGRAAVVVTDVWIMNNELADFFPPIAMGGRGVKGFTAQIYEDLPVAFTRDERVFVQIAEGEKRAAVWGMDQAATREAMGAFVSEGLFEKFLDLVWGRRG